MKRPKNPFSNQRSVSWHEACKARARRPAL
jgi:hypothetical protein